MDQIDSSQEDKMVHGANIIAQNWLHLKMKCRVLIVSSEIHLAEVHILKKVCMEYALQVDLMVVEEKGKKVGVFFDKSEWVFDDYDVIIGATDYSLVTTRAVRRAIANGKKFLSLPLSTNDGRSMLSYEFLEMDTKKSKLMANVIKKYMDKASFLHVTTNRGTDISFRKQGRNVGFFNGDVRDGRGFSSASIELYVPIEEDQTEGVLCLDGSLGYIGAVQRPFKIEIRHGKIVSIEDTDDGKRLKDYVESFEDQRMYTAGEFGIGLNSFAKCIGNCYIEDESAFGTFHIGFGRNLALGGEYEASGHFDLVTLEPDIYADNRKIMEKGKLIIPEPQIY